MNIYGASNKCMHIYGASHICMKILRPFTVCGIHYLIAGARHRPYEEAENWTDHNVLDGSGPRIEGSGHNLMYQLFPLRNGLCRVETYNVW